MDAKLVALRFGGKGGMSFPWCLFSPFDGDDWGDMYNVEMNQ